MKTADLEKIMHEAARKKQSVCIVTNDDEEYSGIAFSYTKADDEEDGYATISVRTPDKGSWCLGTNEIKSLDVVA